MFNVRGTAFDCPDRYQLIQPIGRGAYGIVCSARDRVTGEPVAIKKISGVTEDILDCKRTLREMLLLRHLYHDNVVTLKDIYTPTRQGLNVQDVYMVTELMESDLHNIISSGQTLQDDHVQYFAYQILRALKHIHSANVWHRDLKPSNILLNADCSLKLCDFGLARVVNDGNLGDLTAYVTTRWYRAPEVMLSQNEYTSAVDIWSVGCILAEIVRKRPLFPGNDYVNQLQLVSRIIGAPSEDDISALPSATEETRNFVRRFLMHGPGVPIEEVVPTAPPLLRDLIARMLVFNPQRRITVDQALQHPYLQSMYSLDEEVQLAPEFTFEFDVDNMSRETLKRAIWEEAQKYRQVVPH